MIWKNVYTYTMRKIIAGILCSSGMLYGGELTGELQPIWKGASEDIRADARAAQSTDGLHVRVQVVDPEQHNPYRERGLWQADCIYLHVDGLGDTPEGATDRRQEDDFTVIAAIGMDGPDAVITKHGRKSFEGRAQHLLKQAVRDETNKTTTYEILIPWRIMNSAHGLTESIGLGMLIAHKDKNGNDLDAGKHTLMPAVPEMPFTASTVTRTLFASPRDRGRVLIAANHPNVARMEVRIGGRTETIRMPDAGTLRMERPVTGVDAETDANVLVQFKNAAGQIIEEDRHMTTTPKRTFDSLADRAAALKESTAEPILHRHLDATRLLAERALDRLAHETEQQAEQFIVAVNYILEKLPEKRITLAHYTDYGLPLVCAFISETDRTLQFYSLQLPYGFDPKKVYPLTVYLHGYGTENPVIGLQQAFDCRHQDTYFNYEKIDPDNIPAPHRGFLVAPWGRGNMFYKGAAADDVLQSVWDVEQRFRVDTDRRYLSGFSMGGFGTWYIATHTPDLWAAASVGAAFTQDHFVHPLSPAYLFENLRPVPMVSWGGERDRLGGGNVERFHKACKKYGLTSSFRVAPDLPHTYPYTEYCDTVERLMKYRRTRPDRFSFTIDDTQFSSAYGITPHFKYLDRYADDHMPSFSVERDGQTVRIDTRHIDALHVELGADGLGLQGEVHVLWNGNKAYSGEAKDIFLGEAFRYRPSKVRLR